MTISHAKLLESHNCRPTIKNSTVNEIIRHTENASKVGRNFELSGFVTQTYVGGPFKTPGRAKRRNLPESPL